MLNWLLLLLNKAYEKRNAPYGLSFVSECDNVFETITEIVENIEKWADEYTLSGRAKDLLADDRIKKAYLGE